MILKNVRYLCAIVVVLALVACGGGTTTDKVDSAVVIQPVIPDTTFKLSAPNPSTKPVPGQRGVCFAVLNVAGRIPTAYYGVMGIPFGDRKIAESFKNIYMYEVPTTGVEVASSSSISFSVEKEQTVLRFNGVWYTGANRTYVLCGDIKTSVPSGTKLSMAINDVLAYELGAKMEGSGSLDLVVNSIVGYGLPEVTTTSSASQQVSVGDVVNRTIVLTCPKDEKVSCNNWSLYMNGSDAIDATATQAGVTLSLNVYCSYNGYGTQQCSASFPWNVFPGESLTVTLTSVSSSTNNWLQVYDISLFVGNTFMSPKFPANSCALVVSDGINCKG